MALDDTRLRDLLTQSPAQQLFDLPRQPVAPGFGILDSMDIVLQHDLLRRMIKAHRGEPASICQGPGASPVVNPVVT